MAIASIVLAHTPQDQEALLLLLGSEPNFTGIEAVGPDRIAASLECAAVRLPAFLKKLSSLSQVLDLQLIFASYEDELEEDGYLQMPPEAEKYV